MLKHRSLVVVAVVVASFACTAPPSEGEGEGEAGEGEGEGEDVGEGEGEGEGEGDPQQAVCLASATCSEEPDPAAFCAAALADCEQDPDCEAVRVGCSAEQTALSSCLLTNGTCDTIEGVDGKFFGFEASSDGGACEDESQASADCAADL